MRAMTAEVLAGSRERESGMSRDASDESGMSRDPSDEGGMSRDPSDEGVMSLGLFRGRRGGT